MTKNEMTHYVLCTTYFPFLAHCALEVSYERICMYYEITKAKGHICHLPEIIFGYRKYSYIL